MKKFYCKSFLFENPSEAFDKVSSKFKQNKLPENVEQAEAQKPLIHPISHTSTNRPPDTSSNKRNDHYRTTSYRSKKIEGAREKAIRCFLLI